MLMGSKLLIKMTRPQNIKMKEQVDITVTISKNQVLQILYL